MGLETGTYINDLVATNPLSSDGKDKGDTVHITATVTGSTKTVDLLGASTRYTWFSGHYLP